MDITLFSHYTDAIRSTNFGNVASASQIPSEFLFGHDGAMTAHYIPFDFVNTKAKVVLVGITPGFTQWKNAMIEAQQQLQAGASPEAAQIAAKRTGAFSGAMRPNLVSLLDKIHLHRWLKIESCTALFSQHDDIVQTTSILCHPVFVNNENYNGTPNMVKTPFLRKLMLDHFAKESAQLPDAVYIPLGPKVSEGLSWLVQEGVLKEDRILGGLPHPSGANAERISYFLGKKEKRSLSAKTNGSKLDEARTILISRVQCLA
ncbi:hypothetical protein ACXX82_00930 [Glaciimonas sp. GNP009]